MAENGDVLEQIQKQLEGNTLGLSAVADVLQKMESRLEQAEDYEYEEDLQLAEEEQYGAIIQGVAAEVIAMIKADNEVGIDVEEKRVGGTKLSDASADDGSKTVDNAKGTPTSDAQDVIVSKAGTGKLMKEGNDDEDDDEARRRRRREEEEGNPDEIVQMKKQLEDLQKQIAGYQDNIQKSADGQVVERLQRMGFREENGLQAPKIIPDETLGTEGQTFISKAEQTEDVVEQLSKLSFRELRVLQERVQSGDTEGIPTELLS
jgi:hypothetical protein